MRHVALALLVAGCSARAELPPVDPGLAALALAEVHPGLLLPQSRIDVVGDGFPDVSLGTTRLHIQGQLTPTSGALVDFDLVLPATVTDAQHLSALADPEFFNHLPAVDGRLAGQATVLVDSPIDGQTHASPTIDAAFDIAHSLAPALDAVVGGTHYVNDAIQLTGDGFLLGTTEGTTHALVSGCFLPASAAAGSACATAGVTVTDVDIAAQPATPWDRNNAVFPFSPEIGGIHPGLFTGSVRLQNVLADGSTTEAGSRNLTVKITQPMVDSITPTTASLGQIVQVTGGGFIGAAGDEVTLLHLVGSFKAANGTSLPVDLKLVPEFLDGNHARYVLDEADALGKSIDLRRAAGTFTGSLSPIVRKGTEEEIGLPATVKLTVAPVKQVVYVRFLASYVQSLRLFGLSAADPQVRKRVFEVAARDYGGVNIDFRDAPPTDFALYSQVDIAGPDPNDLGLLGYDNTPGKDVGNQRLFDRLGGVNATTQSDGYPGFGGVFTEQFLGFSAHPGPQIDKLPVDGSQFDQVFDPLRPDQGGFAVNLAEAARVHLTDGSSCPASDRDGQVGCAIFVLGNLIGTTLTHEVGHSLGLADPTGDLFHDPGDEPNRLMDSGDARPFEERAELGAGPAVFCDDEFVYLTTVLPGAPAGPMVARPGCL
jgi:hypothetical protein